jgi:hypothetical protein
LRAVLAAKKFPRPISHSHALEIIAVLEGARDWNALAARGATEVFKERARALRLALNKQFSDEHFGEADLLAVIGATGGGSSNIAGVTARGSKLFRIWPEDARKVFAGMLGFLDDMVHEKFNSPEENRLHIDYLSWAPARKLSIDQFTWMLARLAETWVEMKDPEGGVTAWDDGCAWSIWTNLAGLWSEMAASVDFEAGEESNCDGMVEMLRSAGRLSEADYLLLTATGRRKYGVFFRTLRAFLKDSLFKGTKFRRLAVSPSGFFVSPLGSERVRLGLEASYFRCPIPETLRVSDLRKAEKVLERVAPKCSGSYPP